MVSLLLISLFLLSFFIVKKTNNETFATLNMFFCLIFFILFLLHNFLYFAYKPMNYNNYINRREVIEQTISELRKNNDINILDSRIIDRYMESNLMLRKCKQKKSTPILNWYIDDRFNELDYIDLK